MRETLITMAIAAVMCIPMYPQKDETKKPEPLSAFSGIFAPTPAEEAEPASDPVGEPAVVPVKEVSVLEYRDDRIDDVLAELSSLRSEIQQQAQAHRDAAASVKMQAYPTIDEIKTVVREVVKEEIAAVVLTLKTETEEKKVTVPAPTVSSPESTFDLPPGAVITAIDGVPVTSQRYRSPDYSGYEYSTPRFRVRSFFNGRTMGAIRYGTCGPNGCN